MRSGGSVVKKMRGLEQRVSFVCVKTLRGGKGRYICV